MSDTKQNLSISAILVLLIGLIYGQCWTHDYIGYDDPNYTSQPIVQRGLSGAGVAWAFRHGGDYDYWTPITFLSHMLDFQIFGKSPGLHHLTSVLLHAANSVLLFLLLLAMTQARWPAALAAAIFAVHPLHVESVAWIAERKDVLTGTFFMLTLLAYVAYSRRANVPRYLVVFVCFALALMSKPMVITLPAVMLLLDYWPLKRIGSDDRAPRRIGWILAEKIPLVLLGLGCAAVTIVCQRSVGALRSLDQFPFSYRLANAVVSYGRYLGKTIWPAKLAVFYPAPAGWAMSIVIASAAALLVITAIAIFFYRSRPYLIVGWLWFLGMLLPVIGIVQVGRQAMADRYAYLPQIGLCLMVAWALRDFVRRRPVYLRSVVFLCGIVVALLSFTAFAQVTHWKNTYTLFAHAIEATGDNALAYNQVGNALMRAGRMPEAEADYRKALAIEPKYPLAQTNLGNLLVRKGDVPEAIEHYRIAVALPQHPIELSNAYMGLGVALSMSHEYAAADKAFASAVKADDRAAPPHYAWGVSLRARGKESEAEDQFKAALAIDPNFAPARQELGKNF